MTSYPDTQAVAASFGQHASSYDNAAILQRAVGDSLFGMVQAQGTVLDLGCGTGFYARAFVAEPNVEKVYGLDVAKGMLDYAAATSTSVEWLQADARNIPLADASVDVVFSSLMVQWLGADSALLTEVKRVLKPGGRFVFSTLLDGTLCELKTAWAQVDDAQHVNDFATEQDWHAAITEAGFSGGVWLQNPFVREFDDVLASLRELKALGAHNVNNGRPKAMMGKAKFASFVNAYEQARRDNKIPATYQVLYGVLNA